MSIDSTSPRAPSEAKGQRGVRVGLGYGGSALASADASSSSPRQQKSGAELQERHCAAASSSGVQSRENVTVQSGVAGANLTVRTKSFIHKQEARPKSPRLSTPSTLILPLPVSGQARCTPYHSANPIMAPGSGRSPGASLGQTVYRTTVGSSNAFELGYAEHSFSTPVRLSDDDSECEEKHDALRNSVGSSSHHCTVSRNSADARQASSPRTVGMTATATSAAAAVAAVKRGMSPMEVIAQLSAEASGGET